MQVLNPVRSLVAQTEYSIAYRWLPSFVNIVISLFLRCSMLNSSLPASQSLSGSSHGGGRGYEVKIWRESWKDPLQGTDDSLSNIWQCYFRSTMRRPHKTSASRWWSAKNWRRWIFLANLIRLFVFSWCQEITRSWKPKLSRKILTHFSTRFSNLWLVFEKRRIQTDFSFLKIPLTEVMKKTVVFQVFDWDKVSKTDGIGEVCSIQKPVIFFRGAISFQCPDTSSSMAAQLIHSNGWMEKSPQTNRN